MIQASRDAVRRLAIECQHLADDRPRRVTAKNIVELAREIGCLQIDPISVIAPTQLLVLWSRLGRFNTSVLEKVLWRDRSLFHYWAHAASLVPTEDYPIHAFTMRNYLSLWSGGFQRRVGAWMADNRSMRRSLLVQLRSKGPSQLRELEVRTAVPWQSTGWTNNQDKQRMIEFLWLEGKVVVAGRVGQQRVWDLMDRFLPDWTPKRALQQKAAVERSAIRALTALGVATQTQINYHFTRWRYPNLRETLETLHQRGEIVPVQVTNGAGTLKGKWYTVAEHVDRLEALEKEPPRDSTRLLSPFDNLICDRKRTLALWDFDYGIEIYVPKAKRRYGYYVLPVLHGDRLVGRLDAAVDKKSGLLSVLSIHSEPKAPSAAGTGMAAALEDLAAFRGATDIVYPKAVPKPWAKALR